MGDKTKINWTEATWNPVTGCTKISAGCKNCYAERMAKRLQAMGQYKYRDGFKVTCHPDLYTLEQPLRWTKLRRIFVCSMGDLFHDDVPDEFITRVYDVMVKCQLRGPKHIFQVLTKRPKRMRDFLKDYHFYVNDNIYHGVTVENVEAVWRLDVLREARVTKRFASMEPLVGDPFTGVFNAFRGIDWVIIGGESGPGARPMDIEAARETIECADDSGSKVFMKQMGAVWAKENGSKSRKGDIMEEWPEFFRRREVPWDE